MRWINQATVHFVEHGTGTPLIALHGSGVDHREIEAAVEAIVPDAGYRRIYPDLPGMGRSTTDGLTADAHDELELAQRAGFDEYFVVRTAATARRYRDHVLPGTTVVDEAALGRIFSAWRVDVGSQAFTAPTLIVAGRCDSVVGYTDAISLLERYPHATLAVVEDAGHALMHERPELLAAILADWLDRAGPHDRRPCNRDRSTSAS